MLDVETILCSSFTAMKQVMRRQTVDVLIFDTRTNFWKEYQFYKTVSALNENLVTFVLIEPKNIANTKTYQRQNVQYVLDPFDPETISANVRTVLDVKEKKKYFLLAA
ncbi:hypothetical protein ACFL43_03740 [Thermodesulfobacteriota bacterium]